MKSRILTLLALLFITALLVSACDFFAKPTVTPVPPTAAPAAETNTPTVTPTPLPKLTVTPTVPPAPTTAVAPKTASYEKVSCPFRLPTGVVEGKDVDCGYLVVPEDRSDPQTRMIRLAVAVFHNPTQPVKSDPIIYLSGGPGGSDLELMYLSYADLVKPFFVAGRDIIYFDQRGVGLSKPSQDCPAADELSLQLMSQTQNGKRLSQPEQITLLTNALLACSKDLSSTTKLTAYNSPENAADVNDLRTVLGYSQVNLWGISYGTRLALDVMRQFPQGIRSVVIDSVLPPDVNAYLSNPDNTIRSLTQLFDGCAKDSICNGAYPNLRQVFFDTAASLQQSPPTIKATNPLNNKTYDVLLDGETFIGFFQEMMYQTSEIPDLPKIIYAAKNGTYDDIALLTGVIIANNATISTGMYYSVECNEDVAFTTADAVKAELAKNPDLVPYESGDVAEEIAICNGWGSGKAAAAERQPVTSNLPTLVMSGQYDPATPPDWARHAAQTLSQSYAFEYPGIGHGASPETGCPLNMMVAFINNPATAPDSSCIAKMTGPAFTVPGRVQDIQLVPYTNTDFGISGVQPAGWNQVASGVLARGQSSTDAAGVFQIAVPGTNAQAFAGQFLTQLGVTSIPNTSETYKSPVLTWTIYHIPQTAVQGQQVGLTFATASDGKKAYLVVVMDSPDEIDALSKVVLNPVLDALKSTN